MTVGEAGGYVLAPGDGRARWFLGGLITFKALGEDPGASMSLSSRAFRAG